MVRCPFPSTANYNKRTRAQKRLSLVPPDSHDPFSWYLLGRAFMQLNNYGKAYEAYQQAVYRDGKSPAYWCSIGILYFNINQFHDALDAYTRAVRIHPFIPEIWQNLGTLYESCHDQLADATDAYQRAVQLDPTNAPLNKRLSEVRNALLNGTEIAQAPPPPLDVMPDSKSWSNIHFDLSGAKPVYLDAKILSEGQPSPDGLEDSRAAQSHTSMTAPSAGITANSMAYPGAFTSNVMRRPSLTRPGSAHSNNQPPQSISYLHHPLDDAPGRSRHPPIGNPSRWPQGNSGAPLDIDREPRDSSMSRRVASASRPSYADRPSPPLHEADRAYRHGGSPVTSPRMRAADYEYSLHARSGYPPPPPPPVSSEAEWERIRSRERPSAGDRGRHTHSTAGLVGAPLHSPPQHPVLPSSSTGYGRDYLPPHGASSSSRRRLSPPLFGSRYDESAPHAVSGGSLQPRSGNGPSRAPLHYPYDYYPGPPLPQASMGGPPPPGHHYDHRARYDSRYESLDGPEREREREMMHERELQAHRSMEEEARRRRDIDSSRKDLSPPSSVDMLDIRAGMPPSAARTGHSHNAGKGEGRHSLNGDEPGQVQGSSANATASAALTNPLLQSKERNRRVVGGVLLDSAGSRRNVRHPYLITSVPFFFFVSERLSSRLQEAMTQRLRAMPKLALALIIPAGTWTKTTMMQIPPMSSWVSQEPPCAPTLLLRLVRPDPIARIHFLRLSKRATC